MSNIHWSPNGKHILFDVTYSDSSATNVGIVEWPIRKLRWFTSDGKSRAPRWAADSNSVFYVHNNNEIRTTPPNPVPDQPAGGDYGYDWVGNRLNPPTSSNPYGLQF